MARRTATTQPPFGSDSFLDVTANLVGVLIILIVLVGLRVAKAPPQLFVRATQARLDRRLAEATSAMRELRAERDRRQQQLDSRKDDLTAKETALESILSRADELAAAAQRRSEEIGSQRGELQAECELLAEAQSRLASLANEIEQARLGQQAALPLEHRTPLSRPVDCDEIHFELRGGRVAAVDLAALLERAKIKSRLMEAELRERGRATAEVGPVGDFRLHFAMQREEIPFTESLLYGRGSFRARLVEWEIIPVREPAGEPVDAALTAGSQFAGVLARSSPKRFAATLWTHSDSFAAYRQVRDHLYSLGYSVAARPLPPGVGIRGSVLGSRSFAQ